MATITERITNRLRYTLFPGPIGEVLFRIYRRGKVAWRCPLCGYHGPVGESLALNVPALWVQ